MPSFTHIHLIVPTSNQLFNSTGCAVLPRWSHGLADGPICAAGEEKAGWFAADMGGIGAKTTGESGAISWCVSTQDQHGARAS